MTKEVGKVKKTGSERFMETVIQQFQAETNHQIEMTTHQKELGQHLFLKIDVVLKELEKKRQTDGSKFAPYTWDNINMRNLALDSVHTVQLGLDAALPNHVHPIPYWNSREKKYDLDLSPGFLGKAYYRQEKSKYEVGSIVYELVYETDRFVPIKRGKEDKQDSYEFEIKNPFKRGKLLGGFGYIHYKERSNQLVLVTLENFEKSKSYAKQKSFWNRHFEEMCYKTLVHRTTEKLEVDPKKVSAAFLHMENKDEEYVSNLKQAGKESDLRELMNQEEDSEIVSVDVDGEPTEIYAASESGYVDYEEVEEQKAAIDNKSAEEPKKEVKEESEPVKEQTDLFDGLTAEPGY